MCYINTRIDTQGFLWNRLRWGQRRWEVGSASELEREREREIREYNNIKITIETLNLLQI